MPVIETIERNRSLLRMQMQPILTPVSNHSLTISALRRVTTPSIVPKQVAPGMIVLLFLPQPSGCLRCIFRLVLELTP